MDVVDDLAAFLLTILLLVVADEMAVGTLPAMAHRRGPCALLLIRGCAQTGRADAGGHSALGQSLGACDHSGERRGQHRDGEAESHKAWALFMVRAPNSGW